MRFCSRLARASERARSVLALPLLVAAVLLPGAPVKSFAQAPAHSLACSVRDAQGQPLSDLLVELDSITPPQEHLEALTGPDGSCTFRGLRGASYHVTVASAILLPAKRVEIGSSQSAPLVLQLPVAVSHARGREGDVVSVQELVVPRRVQDMMRHALDAWLREDVHRSRSLAERVLKLRPDFGPALALIGILDFQEGHPADAITTLLQALQLSPDCPHAYLALASAYNQLRRNHQALAALSILAKIAPDSWQLHYETGRAYLGEQRYPESIAEFTRAQNLGGQDNMIVHLGKAHALFGLRDYSSAQTELQAVIAKSPNGPYAAESRQLASALDAHFKPSPPPMETATRPSTGTHSEQ